VRRHPKDGVLSRQHVFGTRKTCIHFHEQLEHLLAPSIIPGSRLGADNHGLQVMPTTPDAPQRK